MGRLGLALAVFGGLLISHSNSANSAHLPDIESEASLSELLTYAALNNPGLEAAFHRWKAAVERISHVQKPPDPTFTYMYFIEEVETRVGPQNNKLGLMQKVPWFGKLKLRGAIAAEAANAAFEEYQKAKLQLFFDVKKAYYEYYYLYRAISITDDNIQLLKHLEGVARSMHRAGGPQTGVIKAQVELGKLDDRLRTLQELRGAIAARLNASLNRPYHASIPWPRQAPVAGAKLLEDEMFEQLSVANPELKTLDKLIKKEEQAIVLAKKAYFPDIMVGIDYIDTDDALIPSTPDSGKDPVIAMIALDIPIWRGKNKAGVEDAHRRHDSAQLERENRENILEADLKMALYRFHDAERKIDLYGDTLLPQAEQALKVTEEAYRSGSEVFLNLIDAERLLLEFQLAHERALADREIALAEVEKLVGKPLGRETTEEGTE